MNNLYKIGFHGDTAEFVRVANLLLRNGYLFGEAERTNKIKNVLDILVNDVSTFNYIIIGDFNCKMIFDMDSMINYHETHNGQNYSGHYTLEDFQEITVEEFLKLNNK